ncbi:sugar phosphate isomerase/epimerase family protein [Candidatus Hydrogenedentota bacterium]
MKTGFFVPALRNMKLPDVIEWAGKEGFDTLEFWPGEKEGGGAWFDSFLNIADFGEGEANEIKGMMADAGLETSCITYSANMLDPAHSDERSATLRKVIDAAQLLGIDTVGCWAGRDYDLKLDENIKLFGEKFPPICSYADDRGVRLAMENCPLFWERQGLIGNLAISPHMWEQLFNEVSDANLGLNFDPSHLYWMQIDTYAAIAEFGSKIFYFHAKDCDMDEGRLAREGNIPFWSMVWRYRIPGAGEFDWSLMLSLLYEHGYEGPLSIEYEDMVYGHRPGGGDPEVVKRGLLLGKRHLEMNML